jgi:hypothetical protein
MSQILNYEHDLSYLLVVLKGLTILLHKSLHYLMEIRQHIELPQVLFCITWWNVYEKYVR